MSGRRVRMTALFNGPFRSANFAYRITSPRVAFDDTGFEDVRAEGRGQLSDEPVSVPVVSVSKNSRSRGSMSTCAAARSEEQTSELQSLMRISYAVLCLKKK